MCKKDLVKDIDRTVELITDYEQLPRRVYPENS